MGSMRQRAWRKARCGRKKHASVNIILNGFIIKPRRSLRFWMSFTGLTVLLLLLLVFGKGESLNAGLDFRLPWNADGDLSAAELHDENVELREKLLILRQNNQVDKQAAALLQKQLIDSQKENFQLRKDLEFYQGIINVKGGRNSPIIHGMRIKPLTYAQGYRLELILLHITNTEKVFEGMLDVAVEGVQDSTVRRFPLNEISLSRNQNYSIRFRNFQRIENDFVLPENFQPQKIFVTLSIDDEDESGLEKVFDWPAINGWEKADVG